ncbi:thiol reductase thioredoxin [Mycobacterium kansasii]|uniref:TlpA family protein disulfide reductase n=1 Tax=Mycobacterium attenuatum TaxID=2341086 RepID=UPI000A0D9BAF|nr:thiol reductase thioredoxin [Mycobacterium kansasii]
MITAIVAVVTTITLATAIGWLITRQSGQIRPTGSHAGPTPGVSDTDLPLSSTGPTIVHFSAPWCGGCIRLRRVVSQVCDNRRGVAHVELDMNTNHVAAQQLSVRSLPTTFIFDSAGRQRYRATGIPTVENLASALETLLG